ncbi:MAG: glycosyltransferase [Chloroflexi bacterium]|nr:glycosyltransferase [Chloroflexota bacterium]
MEEAAASAIPPRSGAVTVVATVLNEAAAMGELLESLCRQTRRPDEMVIVDGGSRDGTVEAIAAFQDRLPLRVLVEPGCSISAGRNRAIAAASGEIIAATDAGVRLEPTWLEELVRPFSAGPDARPDVVCGFFVADPRSVFELALGATTLPHRDEVDPTRFLPSSRSVAFTRAAWARVGGYPEWLDYCEDLVFDLRLKQAGCRFAWAPQAVVRFRPRPDLRSFFLQYYRYARGDGKADLWRRRHAVRYAAYLVLLAALLLGRQTPWLWPPLALGAAGYLRRPLARLWPHLADLVPAQRVEAVACVPVVRLVGDVAKMLGYPAGWWWRWRNVRTED